MGPSLLFLLLFFAVSGLMIGLGIPLARGRVAPNSFYGFRTQRTLRNPAVWYPTNRVAGLWSIATGMATAGVTLVGYLADWPMTVYPFVCVGAAMGGVLAMVVHGTIVSRRAA